MENKHGFIGAESGVLAHTVPHDIVTVSQRERVLEAMAECCEEKTFAGTTIADIVGHAGVSRRTFYKLFANKQACFEAAVGDFAGEIAEAVASAQAGQAPWADAMRETIATLLDLLASKPALTNLAVIEAAGVKPAMVDSCQKQILRELKAPPVGGRLPPTVDTARVTVGTAQVLIAQQIAAGKARELPSLLPDLVYIAVLPFEGQEEALAQARLSR